MKLNFVHNDGFQLLSGVLIGILSISIYIGTFAKVAEYIR